MGHKNVCFTCRKVQNLGSGYENIGESNCPDCGQPMALMTHRFRPPKKDKIKEWTVVEYLVDKGFRYQHIYDEEVSLPYVPYPTNMKDAADFVTKYETQSIKKIT